MNILFIKLFIAIFSIEIKRTWQQQSANSSCTSDFSFNNLGLFTDYEQIAYLNNSEDFKVPSDIKFNFVLTQYSFLLFNS
jgi:hypothetical protein